MPKYFDPEYEIERRIVKGLRAVFEKDDRFVYNKNEKESEINITIDYPDNSDIPLKVPHAILTNISLQTSLHNTFGYNFFRDVSWKGMKNGAQQYAYVIPYSANILCTGDQNTSKDLASRIHWYLSFAAASYFSESLDLQLQEVTKGNSSPSKQFPQKIFDTPISIRGTLYWIGTKGPEEANALDDIDKPLTNIKIKF